MDTPPAGGDGVISTATGISTSVAATETDGSAKGGEGSQRSVTPPPPQDSLAWGELGGVARRPLPLPPERDSVAVLTTPLSQEKLGWVAEAMKVVFNQTVHWKEEGSYSEVGLPFRTS